MTLNTTQSSTTPTDAAGCITAASHNLDQHFIVPDHCAADFNKRVERLDVECRARGIDTAAGILVHAPEILVAMTGTTNFTLYADAPTSHRLHTARNTIATVLAAAELSEGEAAFAFRDRLPAVAIRAGGKDRALADDEIILMRLAATAASLVGGQRLIPAIQYALTDDGALPSETTVISPRSFDDLRHPNGVQAPGVKNLAAPRYLTHSRWSKQIIERSLDTHLARYDDATKEPVAYTGRQAPGGNQASASVSGNLKRLMRTCGLADQNAKPTAITRWRVATTIKQEGITAGMAVCGTTSLYGVHKFARLAPPAAATFAAPAGQFV